MSTQRLTNKFGKQLENLYLLAHFGLVDNPISTVDDYFINLQS